MSKDKVEFLDINLNELNTFSVNHSYEVAENAILFNNHLQH